MSSRRRLIVGVFVVILAASAVWGIVAALQADRLHQGAVERAKLQRAAKEAHSRLCEDERTAAMARLVRIQEELAAGSVPDWAGVYSWQDDDLFARGEIEDVYDGYESIAVAPKAGVVWWCGPRLEFARYLDHGELSGAFQDHVVVEWVVNSRSPHYVESWANRGMLSRELVRVDSDGFKFLVPGCRMPLFCSSRGSIDCVSGGMSPCQGGVLMSAFRSMAHDLERGPERSGVPEPWRDFVLPKPLTARAERKQEPQLVAEDRYGYSFWETPDAWWQVWKPARVWRVYQCDYTIPLGTNHGLRVGMPMFRGEWRERPGFVSDVGASSSCITFFLLTRPSPGGDAPLAPSFAVSTLGRGSEMQRK